MFVGVPLHRRAAWLEHLGHLPDCFDAEPGERIGAPPGLVVIGSLARDPIHEAQRWFHADRAVHVVIAVPNAELANVRARAMTAPYLGKALDVADEEESGWFAMAVRGAQGSVLARRQLARANTLLERARELI